MVNLGASVIMFVVAIVIANRVYKAKDIQVFITGMATAFMILFFGAVVAILVH